MDINAVLNNSVDYIKQQGFDSSEQLVHQIYLSLRSQPFLIFSGRGGTGKSWLPRLFAESLGATVSNGRFLSVPVGADWHNGAQLIGHIGNDGKFCPGAITGFLKSALTNSSKPYFLLLDDFNLSRPEQYMSTFLSVMSGRRSNYDGDPLLPRSFFGNDDISFSAYGEICLPKNLFIFASCFSGEAAYSPTVELVDKAFVIELSVDDITLPYCEEEKNTVFPLEVDIDFLQPEYYTVSECSTNLDLLREYSGLIQKMNRIIRRLPFSLSFRSRDAMLLYALYNYRYDIFDKDNYFDAVISQKLLPRIHGATTSVKNCLCELFTLCLSRKAIGSEVYATSSAEMYNSISVYGCKYPRSAWKIIEMLRRYEDDGYATFWQ